MSRRVVGGGLVTFCDLSSARSSRPDFQESLRLPRQKRYVGSPRWPILEERVEERSRACAPSSCRETPVSLRHVVVIVGAAVVRIIRRWS